MKRNCGPKTGVWSLIGNTPLLPLRFEDEGVTIFAKCEFLNPSGSIKDRIAAFIIGDAERRGLLVAGYGTGGTLAGVGKAIKSIHPAAQVWAMEPSEAALLAGEMPCCHRIEGIADGFIPELLKGAPLDGHLQVSSDEAKTTTLRLNREFGLLVGTSSGANVVVALRLARQLKPPGVIVTLLCDRAERYFSTELFGKKEETIKGTD